MKDFVKKAGEVVLSGGRPVRLEYRERRDGRRAQIVVDRLPIEEGLPGQLRRRYDRLLAAQRRQEHPRHHTQR